MPPIPDARVRARRVAFGKRLRQLREDQGLSQAAVAAAAGLARPYYTGVESGKHNISLDKLSALADALGVDFFTLFEGVS